MADWNVAPGGLPKPVEPVRGEWVDELDEETLRMRRVVDWLSDLMDTCFEVPGVGWRFGFDALIGLIPGIGDVATTVVSLYIIGLAGRSGLPRITVARMALNVLVDMLLGAVPVLGDAFDVWWKANRRNARLLAERLSDPTARNRRATFVDWLFVGGTILALAAVFVGLIALVALVFAAVWQGVARLFG
ncbi:MAG: DUF4112 domain-containing protein [Pirellulales bacterium]